MECHIRLVGIEPVEVEIDQILFSLVYDISELSLDVEIDRKVLTR